MFKAYRSNFSENVYAYLQKKSFVKKAAALFTALLLLIGVTTCLFLTFFYFPLLAIGGCVLSAVVYRVFGGSYKLTRFDDKLDVSVIEEEIVDENRLIFKMETVSK